MFFVEVRQLNSDSSLRHNKDLSYSTHPTYRQIFADLRLCGALCWDVQPSDISFKGVGSPKSLDDKIPSYVDVWVNWNGGHGDHCQICFGIMVIQS